VPQLRIEYKIRDKIDFSVLFAVVALIGIGLVAIYSSTYNNPAAKGNFEKQIIFVVISFIVFFIVYSLPTRFFKAAAFPAYLLSILLLLAVMLIGRRVYGAKSWITIGSLGFQPAEFAKIGTILMLAYFLSKPNINLDSLKDIIFALIIGFIPVFLILIEPDLGTSLVFFVIILVMLFWKGISFFGLFLVLSPMFVSISALFGVYYFIGAILIVAASLVFFKKDIFFSGSILGLNLGAGFFADYLYKALSPHQQKRIQTFINPSADPLGAGYNAMQARLAIGSGGFWGKGFMHGNQTQLQFIPEQWTDFIYCVIGEEFGFIGAVLVLSLFLVIFLRLLRLASVSKDEFLSLTLIGIISVYLIHLIINVGMTIGIMPVIGIPLPFVSYGGSFLLVDMIMLGIAANIFRTRKAYT
jgi:rod shape determining protein RodA